MKAYIENSGYCEVICNWWKGLHIYPDTEYKETKYKIWGAWIAEKDPDVREELEFLLDLLIDNKHVYL